MHVKQEIKFPSSIKRAQTLHHQLSPSFHFSIVAFLVVHLITYLRESEMKSTLLPGMFCPGADVTDTRKIYIIIY
jgi:hypothetical protein